MKKTLQVLGLMDKEKNIWVGKVKSCQIFLNKIVLVGKPIPKDFDRHFYTSYASCQGSWYWRTLSKPNWKEELSKPLPDGSYSGWSSMLVPYSFCYFHQYTMKPGIALACGIHL